jgi:hypothetical protein
MKHSKIELCSFYPIFFPQIDTPNIYKPKDEIWICIPGQVEYKRRDYESLFKSIAQYGLPAKIRLIFLGRCMHAHGDGIRVKKMIDNLGIKSQCLLFDGFVPIDLFFAYIKRSDFILPLIHPNSTESKAYGYEKVSGAFNVAFGFKKVMFCDEYYKDNIDFSDSCIFYRPEELHLIFEHVDNHQRNTIKFYQNPCWDFSYQQKKYLSFLGI